MLNKLTPFLDAKLKLLDKEGRLKGKEKVIYYSDINDREEKLLELNYYIGKRVTPQFSFSDNKLVWVDSRHFNIPIIGRLLYSWFGLGDNPEIYLYDFQTGEEKRITNNRKSQFNPKVSGNRVFWIDTRNGGYDLYYLEL